MAAKAAEGHLDLVGIDPGGRESAVILRRGPKLVASKVLKRKGDGVMPDAAYLNELVDVIGDIVAVPIVLNRGRPLIAVEGVREPSWYMGGKVSPANMGGLMGTCITLGAVMTVFPDAVVVRPGRHGQGAIAAYPEGLRPTRGSGRGYDQLRHARSAWDIAQAGLFTGLQ